MPSPRQRERTPPDAETRRLVPRPLDGTTARIEQSQTVANEYIYAKDMGRAVDLAATVPMPKQSIFNIGNGVVTPFDEVLASVKALFPSLCYEIEPGEPAKSKSDPLDISAAKQHLGWEPKFSLRKAFEDFLAELKASRG